MLIGKKQEIPPLGSLESLKRTGGARNSKKLALNKDIIGGSIKYNLRSSRQLKSIKPALSAKKMPIQESEQKTLRKKKIKMLQSIKAPSHEYQYTNERQKELQNNNRSSTMMIVKQNVDDEDSDTHLS